VSNKLVMKTNLDNIKKTGFKTPDNYFDKVEDKLMNAIKQENNFNLNKETGFKTPDNYFNAIEDVIINKTKNTPKVIQLFSKRNLLYASSIAAAVLLLFNLSIFDKEVTWDSLNSQTVENYIIDEGIDSYELVALFSEDDFSEVDFIEQNITDETLENYLLDNLDIEEIIIE
jgi:hypothetical protein